MTNDPNEARLAELLILWEERREAGETPTVEALCAGCPELAEELARRVQALRALNSFLDPGEAGGRPEALAGDRPPGPGG
jgi:hypothetical protein